MMSDVIEVAHRQLLCCSDLGDMSFGAESRGGTMALFIYKRKAYCCVSFSYLTWSDPEFDARPLMRCAAKSVRKLLGE